MALRFKCSACKEDIVANFYTDTLRIGDTVVCKNCGVGNIIPELNMEEEEKPTTKENEDDDDIEDSVSNHKYFLNYDDDREYEALRLISNVFKVIAFGVFLVFLGFLFAAVWSWAEEGGSFVAQLPKLLMAFGALFIAIILMAFQEIIMLFLNIGGDVLSMSKNFSEIRKAIVDKSD